MIGIGLTNRLQVLRETSVGMYLGDGEGTEVLLPNKYVPPAIEVGEWLDVFCYRDGQERPIATTQVPKVQRNGFAALEVAAVGPPGAFLDWGLEKQLLLPKRETLGSPEPGDTVVVQCRMDPISFRLFATQRVKKHLETEGSEALSTGDAVDILVHRRTDLGWEAIVQDRYPGLVFHSDAPAGLVIGKGYSAFVKQVRGDGKIDLRLRKAGVEGLGAAAETVYEQLLRSDGFLPVHDGSTPETIREVLGMSKKTFKKAIGMLYRERRIEIAEDGIHLVPAD